MEKKEKITVKHISHTYCLRGSDSSYIISRPVVYRVVIKSIPNRKGNKGQEVAYALSGGGQVLTLYAKQETAFYYLVCFRSRIRRCCFPPIITSLTNLEKSDVI